MNTISLTNHPHTPTPTHPHTHTPIPLHTPTNLQCVSFTDVITLEVENTLPLPVGYRAHCYLHVIERAVGVSLCICYQGLRSS